MTFDEWRIDHLQDCKMPLWNFLRTIHWYTETVKIYVITGDCWLKRPEFKRTRDFTLSNDVFKTEDGKTYPELERLLKYYADAPIWNVCAELAYWYDNNGKVFKPCITARVHLADIADEYLQEKEDLKKEKRRKKNESVST